MGKREWEGIFGFLFSSIRSALAHPPPPSTSCIHVFQPTTVLHSLVPKSLVGVALSEQTRSGQFNLSHLPLLGGVHPSIPQGFSLAPRLAPPSPSVHPSLLPRFAHASFLERRILTAWHISHISLSFYFFIFLLTSFSIFMNLVGPCYVCSSPLCMS